MKYKCKQHQKGNRKMFEVNEFYVILTVLSLQESISVTLNIKVRATNFTSQVNEHNVKQICITAKDTFIK
jgi:hypothetical protein